tara:strand:- start:99 stop:335 length:237 start_codon:yes stop_codon:yes gene_type:complete
MAIIISFSVPSKDKYLVDIVDDLATQFDCSKSVIIKRALKMLCKESTIDPVAIKLACQQNTNILNQIKRIVSEVENNA